MAKRLMEPNKWYTMQELRELEKQADAQDVVVDNKIARLDAQIEELQEQITNLQREKEWADKDERFTIVCSTFHLQATGYDMARRFREADPTSKGGYDESIQYADSKRKVMVRKWKDNPADRFKMLPIEEPLAEGSA